MAELDARDATTRKRTWMRPLAARDRHEANRVSTPLELLDLCFVVGVRSHFGPGRRVVAAPVAVYVLSVWLVHRLPRDGRTRSLAFPACAALVLLAPLTGEALPVIALLLVALVFATSRH
jgi:hypothetical protein